MRRLHFLSIVVGLSLACSAKASTLDVFNAGVAAQLEHRENEALEDYAQVIAAQSPLAPVAHYYRAQIFRDRGEKAQAREELLTVDTEKLPPNLRERIESLRADIAAFETSRPLEKRVGERRFALFVDVSEGLNTNPQTLADESSTARPANDRQSQAKLGVNALAWSSGVHDLRATYFYSGTFFEHEPGVNYSGHDFTLPLAFYFEDYRLRFVPETYSDFYGSQPFSAVNGGAVELARRAGDTFWGFSLQASAISNFAPSYSYLHGSDERAVFSVQTEWSTSRAFATLAYGRWHYEDTGTLGSSYDSLALTAGYAKAWHPFDLSLSLLGEQRAYVKIASDPFARVDVKWYADLQAGYALSESGRIYLDISHTENASNFNSTQGAFDPSYRQTIATLGLSWSY